MSQKKTSEELFPSDFIRLAREFESKQVYADKTPIVGDHENIVTYIQHKIKQTMENQRLLEAGAKNKEKKANVRRINYVAKTDRRKELARLREELRRYTEGLSKDGGEGGPGNSFSNSGAEFTVFDPREDLRSELQGAEGADQQSDVVREDDSGDEEE